MLNCALSPVHLDAASSGVPCSAGCDPRATCIDDVCVCPEFTTGDGSFCKDACTCRLRGDPILEQFDNEYLMVVGTCEYTMTKYMNFSDPCSFNVEIKTRETTVDGRRVQGVTEPRYLDIEMFNRRIRLDQDKRVFVGDDLVEVNVDKEFAVDQFRIAKDDQFIVLHADLCSIEIGFYGDGLNSVATVVVPATYSGKMTGLCGDCDGFMNDIRLRDGTDVSDLPDKFEAISQSFCVDESYDNANVLWKSRK